MSHTVLTISEQWHLSSGVTVADSKLFQLLVPRGFAGVASPSPIHHQRMASPSLLSTQ